MATSSRDYGEAPLRKDTERMRKQATVKDAGNTESKDWDKVHGDGSALGLDNPQTESGKRD